MSIERDLLARMQQKLTATLAQVRTLLERRQFADASRLLGDSYNALFGLDRRFLQMMKPPQVVTVLDSLEKVRAFAELMAEEAELLRLQGDAPSAVATARLDRSDHRERKTRGGGGRAACAPARALGPATRSLGTYSRASPARRSR